MAKGEEKPKSAIAPMRIEEIALDHIDIGPQMLRHDQDDDDIIELAGDIAAHGLLQPIGVSPTPNDRYQLHWGSRRLAAYTRLRRTTIPARICTPTDTEGILSTALRENILRRQLTLPEEVDAVRALHSEGLSPSQISDLLGKSRNWVDRRLAFLSLPLTIRDHVIEGNLPLGHAEALAIIEDPSTQSYLLSWTLQNRPSLATLRTSIETIAATPSFSTAVEAGAQQTQPPHSTPIVYLACHTCSTPTPVADLAIIRVCTPCCHTLRDATLTLAENTPHA